MGDDARLALQDLLSRRDPPTALFCSSDQLALRVMRDLMLLGPNETTAVRLDSRAKDPVLAAGVEAGLVTALWERRTEEGQVHGQPAYAQPGPGPRLAGL